MSDLPEIFVGAGLALGLPRPAFARSTIDESSFVSNPAEFFQKKVSRTRRTQQWQAAVTTESDKVQFAEAVVAFQSLGHRTPKPPPSKTEDGAPSFSSLRSEFTAMVSSYRMLRQREDEYENPDRATRPELVTATHFIQYLYEAVPRSQSCLQWNALAVPRNGRSRKQLNVTKWRSPSP
jgi:hypothetical protein